MATSKAVYGIRKIILDKPVAGGFATFTGGDAFQVSAIVKDQFNYNNTAPSSTNIEIEDSDEYFAVLDSDKGSNGFTFQAYDLSHESYKKLLGFTEETDGDKTWYTQQVGGQGKMTEAAIQITTRKQGDNKPREIEYARCKVTITESGTIGKSGFPNFNIECVQLANYGADGTEHEGYRWRYIE